MFGVSALAVLLSIIDLIGGKREQQAFASQPLPPQPQYMYGGQAPPPPQYGAVPPPQYGAMQYPAPGAGYPSAAPYPPAVDPYKA